MRNIWLLPDRQQDGYILAVENGEVSAIHELINVRDLPITLVLGIPEEVIRKKFGQFFLFAQFARLKSGGNIFCISAPAGVDVSGRTVVISNLQFLEPNESPELNPFIPSELNQEEKNWAKKIVANASMGNDSIYAPVVRMLEAVNQIKSAKTFASERLFTTLNKPNWMPLQKSMLEAVNQIKSAKTFAGEALLGTLDNLDWVAKKKAFSSLAHQS